LQKNVYNLKIGVYLSCLYRNIVPSKTSPFTLLTGTRYEQLFQEKTFEPSSGRAEK